MNKETQKINVLSLCDGISCGQYAMFKAGLLVGDYYASEIDKNAITITQKNFPKTIQLGDATKIDYTQFIGKVDLLIAGTPCQDLSRIKSNREGLNGKRSCIFWDYVAAKNTIKPKYFLFENNFGMPDDAKETITKELGVEPILINSNLFSAQSRKRLYWTNIPFEKNIKDKNILLQDVLEFGETPRKKSKTVRCGGGYSHWGDRHEWDMPNPLRRYTTIELERLQTLPDNYTAGVSDFQRRKCIGNGWTVDVIAHILKGIKNDN